MSEISKISKKQLKNQAKPTDMQRKTVINTPLFLDNGGVSGIVIDEFFKGSKNSSIDADEPIIFKKLKLTHGDVVSEVINDFSKANVFINKKSRNIGTNGINKVLEEAIKSSDNQDIDFINISVESLYSAKELEQLSKVEGITRKNLKEKSGEIINSIKSTDEEVLKHCDYSMNHDLVQYFQNVKKLDSLGIPVYVSAGNKSNKINIYTLPQEVNTIGALNEYGDIAKYSSETSLVDEHKPGSYKIKPDKYGGIAISEVIDLYDKEEDVRGTSLASPRAIADDINKEL